MLLSTAKICTVVKLTGCAYNGTCCFTLLIQLLQRCVADRLFLCWLFLHNVLMSCEDVWFCLCYCMKLSILDYTFAELWVGGVGTSVCVCVTVCGSVGDSVWQCVCVCVSVCVCEV
jgi:hypothetical protein